MKDTLYGLIIVFVILIIVIYSKFFGKNYTRYNKKALKADAKIVSITRNETGPKNEKVIRTTIEFDDGFKYVSHKCIREKTSLLTYSIKITPELNQEIINDAIRNHYNIVNETKK